MIDKRVQYGITKFMQKDFFLPPSQSYCLREMSDSGKSELIVEVVGDNLCSEDYDHKGKCNFLREDNEFKLKKSIDHVLLQKKDDEWIVHFIEMKSQVDNKKWYEIRQKTRASYFNICATERVLGIHIGMIKVYTTYERVRFTDISSTADPKTFVQPLGEPPLRKPEEDWNNGVISVNIGDLATFEHTAVKMDRTEDRTKLIGKLKIE